MTVPEHSIDKTPLQIDGAKGFAYIVTFTGRRPEGNAQLLFSKASNYVYEGSRFGQMIESLEPDDIVAHLNEFYPNGNGLDEKSGKYMREGVGSAVFERIWDDSLEAGAKVMYVFSGKESMKRFLDGKGFTTINREGMIHFKRMEEGNR